MVLRRRSFFTGLLTCALVSSSFAIAGVGIYWGNDYSLQMKDAKKEWLKFDDLKIGPTGIIGTLPTQLASGITGKDLPIYLTRTDWKRTLINGGLKVYVDVIPLLDAVELSTNFGLWEYDGSITYPKALTVRQGVTYKPGMSPDSLFQPVYETIPLTLENYGAGFGTLRKTPFMKLQFDFTVRKYILQFPPVLKTLKIYGGGGFSLNFANPVLNKTLVAEAMAESGESLKDASSLNDLTLFSQDKIIQAVVEKILANLMTPHPGLHIDLGVGVKFPVIPLGVYVDGKFLIPFDKMDPNVDLGGLGILLNSGICLSF